MLKVVCDRYNLDKVVGTHAIGHARMATESGVDIKSAHPFWGYPFSDVSVVHNGQLTNYWNNRRMLENKGMRFMSECDSELIAVYIAEKMRDGATLEEGMKTSLTGLRWSVYLLCCNKRFTRNGKRYYGCKTIGTL